MIDELFRSFRIADYIIDRLIHSICLSFSIFFFAPDGFAVRPISRSVSSLLVRRFVILVVRRYSCVDNDDAREP